MQQTQFDIDRIRQQTFVAEVEHHPTLASTNDRASRRAAEEAGSLPLLVLADRQTAGRGRGGSRWWTGEGSLAMSLLLEGPQTALEQPGPSPLIALASALAVVETLQPLVRSQTIGIHWPNDVMIAGGKVAGILVEVLARGRSVIGIGVNTNSSLADAPEDLRATATTLLELTGRTHDQTELLIVLLGRLEDALEQLSTSPQQIAARANELCLQHGRTLTLKRGSRQITGRCAGIAADGALLLDTEDGQQAHCSGELVG